MPELSKSTYKMQHLSWFIGFEREESWFQYYIKTWTYLDIDDETDEIYTEENLLEEWVQRPEKP